MKSAIDSQAMKKGAALVVVMWVLILVAMIVSVFAFEMQMEARIISAQRKRLDRKSVV